MVKTEIFNVKTEIFNVKNLSKTEIFNADIREFTSTIKHRISQVIERRKRQGHRGFSR